MADRGISWQDSHWPLLLFWVRGIHFALDTQLHKCWTTSRLVVQMATHQQDKNWISVKLTITNLVDFFMVVTTNTHFALDTNRHSALWLYYTQHTSSKWPMHTHTISVLTVNLRYNNKNIFTCSILWFEDPHIHIGQNNTPMLVFLHKLFVKQLQMTLYSLV